MGRDCCDPSWGARGAGKGGVPRWVAVATSRASGIFGQPQRAETCSLGQADVRSLGRAGAYSRLWRPTSPPRLDQAGVVLIPDGPTSPSPKQA